jgi:hypothetical protein
MSLAYKRRKWLFLSSKTAFRRILQYFLADWPPGANRTITMLHRHVMDSQGAARGGAIQGSEEQHRLQFGNIAELISSEMGLEVRIILDSVLMDLPREDAQTLLVEDEAACRPGSGWFAPVAAREEPLHRL